MEAGGTTDDNAAAAAAAVGKENLGAKRSFPEEEGAPPPGPAPAKAPRRVMPVPITATSGADAAGAPSGSSGGNGNHAAGPSTANSSSRRDPVADSDDDADSDIDPEHRAHLRDLPEDELQALIDEFFIRKERFDDAVAMLVHGPPGRKLGQAHPSVCASRLERELTVLAELRAARAAEDKPAEGEEFEVLMADTLAILQDDLDEEHEEASRAFTEQADEVEAAGFSVV